MPIHKWICFVLLASSIVHAKDTAFENAKKAFDSGKYTRALELFSQLSAISSEGGTKSHAYYYQGLIFFELGYFYSSYLCFRNVLLSAQGQKELYEKSIKNAVIIADKLNIMEQLGKVLDKIPPILVVPSVAALNHYSVGVYHYSSSNLEEAQSHLKSVSPDSQFYPKALFYLGVMATKKKDYKEATAFFGKIMNLTKGNREQFPLQELSRLNLARVVYSAGDIERSVEVYSQFVSSSPHWLSVLLEASWPLMRVNDTTVSLGNLHSVTAPFYRDQLVGEAFILRATILYNLCKYEEMRQTLAQFFEVYDPIVRAMQSDATRMSGGDIFFKAFTTKKLHPAFLAFLKRDDGINRDLKVIELLKAERRNLSKISRLKQLEWIKDKIDESERELSTEVGTILESLFRRKLTELLEQREQANYLKVEIVTGEKELIEGQKGLPPKRIVDVETSISEGYEFWPFHGEYWEDELGAYVYTTESACVR